MEIIKHVTLLEQFVSSIKPETKGSQSILISTRGVTWGVYKVYQQTQTQTHFAVSDLHRLGGPYYNQHSLSSAKLKTSAEKNRKRKTIKFVYSFCNAKGPQTQST